MLSLAMTDETKEKAWTFVIEFLKQVGFPVAVCCVLLWFGYEQFESQRVQFEAQRQEHSESNKWVRDRFGALIENNTAALHGVERALDSLESRRGGE